MKEIPYGHQDINEDDIQAVLEVLRSDWLTQGPSVARFEQAIAVYCGVRYAVAVSSATAALHIACLAAGLGEGNELWTSPITFVASANCGLYCGARVDFVDIDPRTYNMSPQALEAKLGRTSHPPKTVVPVHFAGQSCEMRAIQALKQKYGFTVIEDASHAIGGRYAGNRIGSCEFSDMAVLSFHPVKIITTAEGGMVLTNREDLYQRLIRLRTHGITKDPDTVNSASSGGWYYAQVDLGYNYRLSDLHAALGTSQLKRVDSFVDRRRELVKRYEDGLRGLPLTLPWQHSDTYSAFHLYVVRIQPGAGQTRREVYDLLRKAGIGVNVHYIPVYHQPYYERLGFQKGACPEAEAYYEEAITLPLFPAMTSEQQDRVISTLKGIFEQ